MINGAGWGRVHLLYKAALRISLGGEPMHLSRFPIRHGRGVSPASAFYHLMLALIFGAGSPASIAFSPSPSPSPLTIEDVIGQATLSKPALSSDGSMAAVIVSRPDLSNFRYVSSLVVIDTRSGAQKVIATGEVHNPMWAPRGKRLAWLAADAAGIPQVTQLDIGGASAKPKWITRAESPAGVRAFAWSPTGEVLAYLAPAPTQPHGEARFDHSFTIADSDYLGTSYVARSSGPEAACLYLQKLSETSSRQLTCEPRFIESVVWSADGGSLILNTHPGTSVVSERLGSISNIGVVEPKVSTMVPAPANVSADVAMKVSATGALAYLHFRGADPWLYQDQVAVVNGGQARDVTTSLDRSILDFAWLPDGGTLLVEAGDHLAMAYWTVGLDGSTHRMDLGPVNPAESGVAVSRDMPMIAFIASEASRGAELYVMEAVNGRPRRLTHFNDILLERNLGTTRRIAWHNDGFEHEGVLTFPPDFKRGSRYPLLVSIHGGPEATSQLSFNGESQFYAAHGWIVFEPNYRGSDGQGERYRSAIIGDATAGAGRDIRAGLAAVENEGFVDPARVAVTGYSWGGVMTSWLIGHHNDWCAAVPGGVAVDFKGYYDLSDTAIWISDLLGSPHTAAGHEIYAQQSPTSYLHQATTPTLVFHNVGDDNAPITQAYELWHALRDNHTEAQFVAFDVDGHDPRDPLREKQMLSRTLEWIDKHCRPPVH